MIQGNPLPLAGLPVPARQGRLRIARVNGPEQRVQQIARQVQASIRGEDGVALREYLIRNVISRCPDRDDVCHIRAIYWFIRRNLRYIQDPQGLDLYPTALQALRIGGEDCDGHVIVGNTMLALVGFPVGAKVVKSRQGEWHIYGRVGFPRDAPEVFFPFDTTWPLAAGPGDEVPEDQVVWSREWIFDLRRER